MTIDKFIKFLEAIPEEDRKLDIEYIDFSWVGDVGKLVIGKQDFKDEKMISITD